MSSINVLRIDTVIENLENSARKYELYTKIKRKVTFKDIYDNYVEMEKYDLAQRNTKTTNSIK